MFEWCLKMCFSAQIIVSGVILAKKGNVLE